VQGFREFTPLLSHVMKKTATCTLRRTTQAKRKLIVSVATQQLEEKPEVLIQLHHQCRGEATMSPSALSPEKVKLSQTLFII